VVICLEPGADLHMVQLMHLPLTVSCFSKIQIDSTFLVPAHLGSPEKGQLNGCVCVCVCVVSHHFPYFHDSFECCMICLFSVRFLILKYCFIMS